MEGVGDGVGLCQSPGDIGSSVSAGGAAGEGCAADAHSLPLAAGPEASVSGAEVEVDENLAVGDFCSSCEGEGEVNAWGGWSLAVECSSSQDIRIGNGARVCVACSLSTLQVGKRWGRARWYEICEDHFETAAHRRGLASVKQKLVARCSAPDLAQLGGEEYFVAVAAAIGFGGPRVDEKLRR